MNSTLSAASFTELAAVNRLAERCWGRPDSRLGLGLGLGLRPVAEVLLVLKGLTFGWRGEPIRQAADIVLVVHVLDDFAFALRPAKALLHLLLRSLRRGDCGWGGANCGLADLHMDDAPARGLEPRRRRSHIHDHECRHVATR